MPFTSRWFIENRVVYTEVVGKLSSQEALEMSDAHAKYLDAGTKPVHILANARQLESAPINMRQNMQMGQYLRHPSLGWLVVVNSPRFVTFVISMLGQVLHMRYATRNSFDEGMAFLASQDSSLQLDQMP
jgi:hypothetical protein